MAGKIPRSFIDDLLARTDIVDLIDGKIGLKKAGKDYQACCPFHGEKNALIYSVTRQTVLSLFWLRCSRQCYFICYGI